MNRRRRKIITRVVVFIIAGAIVNVAVAWGCLRVAHTLTRELKVSMGTSNDEEPPMSFSYVGFGSERVIRTGESSLTPAQRQEMLSARLANDWSGIRSNNDLGRMVEGARGWPSVCLYWYVERATGSFRGGFAWGEPESFRYTSPTGVQTMRAALVPSFHFPCLPIWPGFAINTIFYAGVLWMVFAFPFVMRRRRRIKRGLCPACAYPVGESEVCTECGARVKGASK